MAQNYTLGRGEIYLDRFADGTQVGTGERYIGNTPEFSLTIDSENLDHYSSDRGVREKDDSVTLEVTRSGTLTTDNIVPENVALFFFGTQDVLTVTGATYTDEALGAVTKGFFYQLGVTPTTPSGRRQIVYPGSGGTVFALKKGVTVLVHGTDYVLDTVRGRVEILTTSVTVSNGDALTATYTTQTSSRQRIISGSAPVSAALRFVAKNPKGANIDYYMPYVTLRPNGDYALKSDEWQTIPFSVEVLRKGTLEAIYADGVPFAVS